MREFNMKTKLTLAALCVAAATSGATPLPWQPRPMAYPWQGFLTLDANAMLTNEVSSAPVNAGQLFASINWYQPINNPNAGSAIEQVPNYMGLIWWDFIGGHDVRGADNSGLPLRLTYAEIVSGQNVTSWFQIPQADDRIGLAQIEPNNGGWVTHINLYARNVPETGNAIVLLALGLLPLMGLQWKRQ